MALTEKEELALRRTIKSSSDEGDERSEFEARKQLKEGLVSIPNTSLEFDINDEKGQRDLQSAMGRDPNVSQKGVDHLKLRATLSRADTREEREVILAQTVGMEGFTRDKFDNLAITPVGMEALGLEPSDTPVVIDSPGPELGDIADLRDDAGAIIGGTAAAIATGGSSIPFSMLAAGAGAFAGKAIDETGEQFRGQNLQSFGEVVKDVALTGVEGVVGEGVFRGVLAPIGRKILAPSRSATGVRSEALREGGEELLKDATEIGVIPRGVNLIDRNLVKRMANLVETVFGDPNAIKNSKALSGEIERLRTSFNSNLLKDAEIGQLVKGNVTEAVKVFKDAARKKFAFVDTILKGKPIIGTNPIKEQAQAILDALPKTVDGKVIETSGGSLQPIRDLANLQDNITVETLQGLRNLLFDRLDSSLLPGVGSRDAAKLLAAADNALDGTIDDLAKLIKNDPTVIGEIGSRGKLDSTLNKQALEQLKEARAFYKEGIQQFENATIKRIAKDPSLAGSLDPERVVDLLFNKQSTTPLKQVLKVVDDKTSDNIRSAAMRDILKNVTGRSEDPLVGEVFKGTQFLKSLDSFGKETLETMFGKGKTDELFRLGRVIQSATKQGGSGGLVAAEIAVNPLTNIPTLIRLKILSNIFASKNGVRWLTTGIEAPKTKAGVAALTRLATQVQSIVDEEETKTPGIVKPSGDQQIREAIPQRSADEAVAAIQ